MAEPTENGATTIETADETPAGSSMTTPPPIEAVLIMQNHKPFPVGTTLCLKVTEHSGIVQFVQIEPEPPTLETRDNLTLTVNEKGQVMPTWVLRDTYGNDSDRRVGLEFDDEALEQITSNTLDGVLMRVLKPGDHILRATGITTYGRSETLEFIVHKAWPEIEWNEEAWPEVITLVAGQPYALDLSKLVKAAPGQLTWLPRTNGRSDIKENGNILEITKLAPGQDFLNLKAVHPDSRQEKSHMIKLIVEPAIEPEIELNANTNLDDLHPGDRVIIQWLTKWPAGNPVALPKITQTNSTETNNIFLLDDAQEGETTLNIGDYLKDPMMYGQHVLIVSDFGETEVGVEMVTAGGQRYQKKVKAKSTLATTPTRPKKRAVKPKTKPD